MCDSVGCMKVKALHRGLLILLIGIFLVLPCFGQTPKLKLTAEVKSQVVKSVLKQFFEDYPDVVESDEVVLSSLNINSSFVPKQSRVKLLLLSPDEINAKIVHDGFVDYLVFSKFKITGSKVLVTLESFHSVEYNSEIIPAFGHGFEFRGSRKSGQWKFECFNTSSFSTNLIATGTGR